MALLRSLSLDEKGGASLLPEPDCDVDELGRPRLTKDQPEESQQLSQQQSSGPYLPDECVKLIQAHLIAGEPLGVALLHLLSMASVCRQWRTLAAELPLGSAIAFDCFDNAFPVQPTVQKFRKLKTTDKEEVFASAVRLLTGYGDVLLAGEGISDRVLQELAAKNGPLLTKCKVQTSARVTDLGLLSLVAHAKKLQSLELQGLPCDPCAGNFLPLLFDNCEDLTSLQLSNIPRLDWRPCKEAAQSWVRKGLTKLTVRGVNIPPDFGLILSRFPNLLELEIDGEAKTLKDAAVTCPLLTRVSYTVSSRTALDEALTALMSLQHLRHLELVVKNFTLCTEQLRLIGMLPLVELRLDSFIHKQQPTLSRSSYSHVDNEGVKALVDSICTRWCNLGTGDMQPLKLSLCGASALTHDAVSALLRLPILTELDIGGCARIIAMDKMRLVAKVRAGRELLDSGRRPATRTSRFPGLLI